MRSHTQPSRAFFAVLLVLSPGATVAAQMSRACWLVTPAEAAQILGKPELSSGEVMRDDYPTCDYLRAGFDAHVDHARPVARVRASLEEGIKNNKVEAIAGIGDNAGWNKSAGEPSLIAVKGTHVVEIRSLSWQWKGSPDQVKPTLSK